MWQSKGQLGPPYTHTHTHAHTHTHTHIHTYTHTDTHDTQTYMYTHTHTHTWQGKAKSEENESEEEGDDAEWISLVTNKRKRDQVGIVCDSGASAMWDHSTFHDYIKNHADFNALLPGLPPHVTPNMLKDDMVAKYWIKAWSNVQLRSLAAACVASVRVANVIK